MKSTEKHSEYLTEELRNALSNASSDVSDRVLEIDTIRRAVNILAASNNIVDLKNNLEEVGEKMYPHLLFVLHIHDHDKENQEIKNKVVLDTLLVETMAVLESSKYFYMSYESLDIEKTVGTSIQRNLGPYVGDYTLSVYPKKGGSYNSIDLGDLASSLFRRLDHIFEQRCIEDEMKRDALTGMWNKDEFHRYMDFILAACFEEQRNFTLLMIDINNFKQVNDQYGHIAGDTVIQCLASVLNQVCSYQPPCIISGKNQFSHPSSWGGDEFALALPGISNQQADSATQEIIQIFESYEFYYLDDDASLDLGVSLSIGGSYYTPEEIGDTEDMMQHADQTMFGVKRILKRNFENIGSDAKKIRKSIEYLAYKVSCLEGEGVDADKLIESITYYIRKYSSGILQSGYKIVEFHKRKKDKTKHTFRKIGFRKKRNY